MFYTFYCPVEGGHHYAIAKAGDEAKAKAKVTAQVGHPDPRTISEYDDISVLVIDPELREELDKHGIVSKFFQDKQ
jgi:hypothetical protein